MAYYEGAVMRIKLGTKDIYHEVDAELTFSNEFTEIASKDTPGKISTPGAQSFSLSCSASLIDNDGSVKEDLFSITSKAKSQELVAFTFTTGASGDVVFSGNVYIEGFTVGAVNEEKSTASYTLKGNGDLNIAQVA